MPVNISNPRGHFNGIWHVLGLSFSLDFHLHPLLFAVHSSSVAKSHEGGRGDIVIAAPMPVNNNKMQQPHAKAYHILSL